MLIVRKKLTVKDLVVFCYDKIVIYRCMDVKKHPRGVKTCVT